MFLFHGGKGGGPWRDRGSVAVPRGRVDKRAKCSASGDLMALVDLILTCTAQSIMFLERGEMAFHGRQWMSVGFRLQ